MVSKVKDPLDAAAAAHPMQAATSTALNRTGLPPINRIGLLPSSSAYSCRLGLGNEYEAAGTVAAARRG